MPTPNHCQVQVNANIHIKVTVDQMLHLEQTYGTIVQQVKLVNNDNKDKKTVAMRSQRIFTKQPKLFLNEIN